MLIWLKQLALFARIISISVLKNYLMQNKLWRMPGPASLVGKHSHRKILNSSHSGSIQHYAKIFLHGVRLRNLFQ